MSEKRYKEITSGIYCIVNKLSNMMYIGSAINLRKRKHEHLLALRKNIHPSRYLQFAYNKYGADNFEFRVLQIVNDVNDLTKVEQGWINWVGCLVPKGYNLAPTARSQLGFRHSEESIKLMSLKKKGTRITAETKAKMSAVRKGKKQSIEWIEKRMKLEPLVLITDPIIIKAE